jgi:hypothetical protein
MSDTNAASVINGSSLLIKLDTKEYPRYYRDLKNDNPQTIFSSDTLAVESLKLYGYAVVYAVDAPTGDQVTQGDPELRDDGNWYQTWTVVDIDPNVKLTETRATLIRQADDLVETELSIGFPFTKEVDGTEVTYHLQAGEKDRANWLGVYQVASVRKAAGITDTAKLRTYENTFIELTPDEIMTNLMTLLGNIDAAYNRFWAFKDKVNALSVGDEVPAVPETFLS